MKGLSPEHPSDPRLEAEVEEKVRSRSPGAGVEKVPIAGPERGMPVALRAGDRAEEIVSPGARLEEAAQDLGPEQLPDGVLPPLRIVADLLVVVPAVVQNAVLERRRLALHVEKLQAEPSVARRERRPLRIGRRQLRI